MNRTAEKLLINTKELQDMLSCGRHTAEKIGKEAGARIQIGRSVRWKVLNIKEYLKDKEVIEQ